jgi:hypothetical protein
MLRIGIVTDAPKTLVRGLRKALVGMDVGGATSPDTRENEVRLGARSTIHVTGLSDMQVKLRSFRGLPSFAFVHSLSYGLSEAADTDRPPAFAGMSTVMAVTQAAPEVETTLTLGPHFSPVVAGAEWAVGVDVKEIVLPVNPNTDSALRRALETQVRGSTGVYELGGVVFRLLPTSFTSIVLNTGDLDHAIAGREERGIAVDLMGNRALGQQQARLIHPDLLGLDLRMCDRAGAPLTFFHESNDALMEGLLPGVQSNRIHGGGPEVKEDKFQTFGDCYSEFREMMGSPSRFVTGKAGSVVRVARAPSLKE